jgi:hypothetical protein
VPGEEGVRHHLRDHGLVEAHDAGKSLAGADLRDQVPRISSRMLRGPVLPGIQLAEEFRLGVL